MAKYSLNTALYPRANDHKYAIQYRETKQVYSCKMISIRRVLAVLAYFNENTADMLKYIWEYIPLCVHILPGYTRHTGLKR